MFGGLCLVFVVVVSSSWLLLFVCVYVVCYVLFVVGFVCVLAGCLLFVGC